MGTNERLLMSSVVLTFDNCFLWKTLLYPSLGCRMWSAIFPADLGNVHGMFLFIFICLEFAALYLDFHSLCGKSRMWNVCRDKSLDLERIPDVQQQDP